MTDLETDLITALVCTRNRGDSIVRTVRSILANRHPKFELIVVDQSTDDCTATAISPFLHDPRLRYIRTETSGKTRALNLGLARARSEIVAITDDDCEVPPDWLEKLEDVFKRYPGVAVGYCNVDGAPHDTRTGFIPAYQQRGSKLVLTLPEKLRARGIGAGMAVRRPAVMALGGFDEMLGPGGVFPSADEWDITVRALLKGYGIYETDNVAVTHYGFRTYSEGRALARRDWLAIGAAYAKPIKCGYWRFIVVPAYELVIVALGQMLWEALRFRRFRGLIRVTAFVRGFLRGWRTPVDRKTLLFETGCRQIVLSQSEI